MTTTPRFALWFAAALAGSGCAATAPATAVGMQPYQPLVMPSRHAHEALAAAVRSTLADLPDAQVSAEGGSMRAILPNGDGTRDVMVVQVRGNTLEVDVRTEIADRGGWLRAESMCTLYHWSRERQLAERIVTAAGLQGALAQK